MMKSAYGESRKFAGAGGFPARRRPEASPAAPELSCDRPRRRVVQISHHAPIRDGQPSLQAIHETGVAADQHATLVSQYTFDNDGGRLFRRGLGHFRESL